MILPKLYAPVLIEFWSLRNGIGAGYGVVFDIDTKVTRKCIRVLSGDSWCWQIADYYRLREWDCFVEVDQECLSNYGAEEEVSILSRGKAQ